MKINWNEAIVKPWGYIKKYRFLWGLGILAALTEGGFGGYSGSGSSWSGGDQDFENFGNTVGGWISQHYLEIGIVLAGLFLISLVVLYISYCARAGLIYSVNSLESDKTEVNFGKAFAAGQKYFWRFLGLALLIALIVFAIIVVMFAVIAGLIALVVALSLWFLLLIIPVGIAVFFGFIVLAAYINAMMNLAYRQIVIKNNRIIEAIRETRKLIAANFSKVIIAYLIQLAVGTVVGLALIVALMFIGGVLLLIGVGIYFLAKWTGVWIYASIAVLVLIAGILVISGATNAYISAFWTVVYRRLVESS